MKFLKDPKTFIKDFYQALQIWKIPGIKIHYFFALLLNHSWKQMSLMARAFVSIHPAYTLADFQGKIL